MTVFIVHRIKWLHCLRRLAPREQTLISLSGCEKMNAFYMFDFRTNTRSVVCGVKYFGAALCSYIP